MHRFLFPKKDLPKGYEIDLNDFYFMRSDNYEKSEMVSAISSLEVEGRKLLCQCKFNTPLLKEYIQ